MLADHGEFVPFAVALDTSGETRTVMGDPGSGERASRDEVLDVLIAGQRSDRNTLRAVALVADVRMSDSDAVQVELEHSEGPAMAAYQHYRPRRFRNGVRFEGSIAGVASPSIWS